MTKVLGHFTRLSFPRGCHLRYGHKLAVPVCWDMVPKTLTEIVLGRSLLIIHHFHWHRAPPHEGSAQAHSLKHRCMPCPEPRESPCTATCL